MTAPTFILITSIIVRIGEGGLTDAQPFTTFEACLQSKIRLDTQLKTKVAALDRCEEAPARPIFTPPHAVDAPPPTMTPIPKPAKAVAAKSAKVMDHSTVRAPSSHLSKNCLHRKYRLVNGVRQWYCKRWK